jgi:dethiobiotin synthetase
VRGLFVTGTDTEVGKTIVAAAACAALVARGQRVAAFKPVVTGLDDDPPDPWPRDHELLAAQTGQASDEVAPYRYGPPVSPHYATELAGETIEPAQLVAHARRAAARVDLLVAEGVGGLLVPLTPGYLVRDLALELELPLVIAARPGLGTINHTLLTIEAARAAGLHVAGVALTPWPADPAPNEHSNRATIERLSGAPVSGLPATDPNALAAAGSTLPLDDWLAA